MNIGQLLTLDATMQNTVDALKAFALDTSNSVADRVSAIRKMDDCEGRYRAMDGQLVIESFMQDPNHEKWPQVNKKS